MLAAQAPHRQPSQPAEGVVMSEHPSLPLQAAVSSEGNAAAWLRLAHSSQGGLQGARPAV